MSRWGKVYEEAEYACPYLDTALEEFENATQILLEILDINKIAIEADDYDYIQSCIDDHKQAIETVRGIAEQLRGWGKQEEGKVKDFETQVEELEDELREAKRYIESLEADLTGVT